AGGRIFAEQPGSPPSSQAILILSRTEHLDEASEAIEAFAAKGRADGSATVLAQAAYLRSSVAYWRGEIAQAEAEARSAVEGARRGGFIAAVPPFVAVYLDALVERGELVEADEELTRSGAAGPLPADYWWEAVLHS